MSDFRAIQAEAWEGNVFQRIGRQWMLICVDRGSQTNLMTASWGGMGILWKAPVTHAYVRPQRFTRELIDAADRYTLLFFDEKYREQLTLCGTKSGRDTDKIAACGFTKLAADGMSYVAEASAAVFCRKLYAQDLTPRCFVDESIPADVYPDGDFHRMYIGEITNILVK